MKKFALRSVVLTLVIIFSAGCAGTAGYSFDGYEDAVNAKSLYASLDSAHFYMRDNSTGTVTEEFSFMYREDGNMVYSYMGTDGETVYYEFHNGSEINYKNAGDESWSFVEQGDENYYVYSKSNKHPYASESVIALNADAITDSSVEKIDGGEKITFCYNADKLASALSQMGELQSFESSLWLNSDGFCFRLDQKALFLDNGEEFVSDFSMFIDQMNEIAQLERPDV